MSRKPSGNRKACDIRAEQGQARRDAFIEAILAGRSVKEAVRLVGWGSESTYYRARSEHPKFRARAEWAIQEAKQPGREVPPDSVAALANQVPPTFAGRTEKYFHMTHLPQQLELANALNDVKPGEFYLFLLWPEAGKTTTLYNWISDKLARAPNHRIADVGASLDLSTKMSGRLRNRMTNQAQFGEWIGRFGPFYEKGQERKGRPWGAEYFTVAGSTHDEQDYSFQARGWTSEAYGSRIDTLIIDDVQSRKSLGQTAEIVATLRQTYFTRGKEMRILMVGTRIGPGDVYQSIIDDGLPDKIITRCAMDADGNPTVPEAWANSLGLTPREFMEKTRARVGEDAWWSSYQQQPLSSALSTFGAALDSCLDHDRNIGDLINA